MATEIKAPEAVILDKFSLFLGGAIDQGKAANWQKEVVKSLKDLDVVVLNPRRDNWDSSIEEDADNKTFREQVEWEISGQEKVDLRLYVFTKDSKAPITFFEMGAFGTDKDSVVCAEDGFYRQGNLDIYCQHFKIPMYHDFDEMLTDLHEALEGKVQKEG